MRIVFRCAIGNFEANSDRLFDPQTPEDCIILHPLDHSALIFSPDFMIFDAISGKKTCTTLIGTPEYMAPEILASALAPKLAT